jgi:phospho-N-acetylmuramoyl-pentapeptide-transferase
MLMILTFAISVLTLYVLRNISLFFNVVQPQREIVQLASEKKKYKPVPCGGILFMFVFTLYSYFYDRINYQFWIVFAFFLVGLIDDIGKIAHKSHISFMSGRVRFCLEIVIAGIFAYFFVGSSSYIIEIKKLNYTVAIPFLIALPLIIFIVVGTLNAVNLTDGQDGLAGKVVLVHLGFIFAIAGLDVVMIGVLSCLLAFLLFNTKPATVYMGDSGSMFLGAYLVILYFNNKIEYILPLTGIVLVVETVSVILQVYLFKLTGKRLFKMAPFHHHLEKCGVAEEKTVSLAFCVTILVCFVAYNLV